MLLPTYDVFDESRYFQPADRQSVYGLDNEQLGITICEDVWNDKTFWANCRLHPPGFVACIQRLLQPQGGSMSTQTGR